MKLQDCDCGGIPQVTYKFNDSLKFLVGCVVCGKQTPICRSLREAVTLWNQIYWCALSPYENEFA